MGLTMLGECKLIEEIMIGEDRLISFSGCKSNAACTLVLRGASAHVLEEAERSMHDALCVLSRTVADTRTICGGGCTEILMAGLDMYNGTIADMKELGVRES